MNSNKSPISGTGWTDFDRVFHATHIRTMDKILDEGNIAAIQPNGHRAPLPPNCQPVVWLSPNNWNPSHFGPIQLKLSWPEIFGTKKLFWVGKVLGRKLPTDRILITDQPQPGLAEYDPASGESGIKLAGERWYRNLNHNSELIFEGDIPIAQCRGINTVSHDTCEEGDCDEKWPQICGAAIFLASRVLTKGCDYSVS
jgi:hypothetical protein